MKGKKFRKKYPVSLGSDPESITDPKKAQETMEDVDKIQAYLIKKGLEKNKKPVKGDRGQKHK
ncbi:MAG: hypothetical protein A2Y67_01110 [Candidatus Buchananbacteria bacterium RBG_13_39_9]|uniref:Uncharacterized protein n=1 Tax=Candidatus Buchananbacteria bacterium RBG_13_39_9 TaxID=1797531 RepID=A0A1G1XQU5_9BACT|nr:MAG: hypothetical protein A2Y67_01110 [Candidatus Buchananbacteria bacterium RBG_13_39_9]